MAHKNTITTLNNGGRKSVGDPTPKYDSLAPVYKQNRACLSGQRYVRDLDNKVSTNNLLIPFSPTMTQDQYDWYTAESEWPGITEQYARTLIGGLLRKQPQLTLAESAPLTEEQRDEIRTWIMSNFGRDNQSMTAFLDTALWEELNTGRAWIGINYPVTNADTFKAEELQPYPILFTGESIINWSTGADKQTGKVIITRLIVRAFSEQQSPSNPYHNEYIDTVWVHQLDDQGYYEVVTFEVDAEAVSDTEVIAGTIQQDYSSTGTEGWKEVAREANIIINGDRLTYIPIYPLNGSIEPQDPMLTNLINREIGLYNNISRRNHLLYGSAAYTPVISTNDLTDEDKQEIVSAGLGSWMFLMQGDTASILAAPTDALKDLDRAIESRLNEMARLGIRLLSPEGGAQSGVALEIRNAAQTSQLATMNQKISQQMQMIIITMVNWRYNLELTIDDIDFELSSDFNPAPIGEAWVRMVAEWYQSGIISKSAFIEVAKQNDILPSDYDPEAAQEEIEGDALVVSPREQFDALQVDEPKE